MGVQHLTDRQITIRLASGATCQQIEHGSVNLVCNLKQASRRGDEWLTFCDAGEGGQRIRRSVALLAQQKDTGAEIGIPLPKLVTAL